MSIISSLKLLLLLFYWTMEQKLYQGETSDTFLTLTDKPGRMPPTVVEIGN
jgi:hypothetical protein